MAYLRIHCDVCGGTWEIYDRDRGNDKARQCPHCFSEIDAQTWARQIVPAFCMVSDANRELYKDSTGQHTPLFTFDVIADHIYTDYMDRERNRQSCPLAERLQELDDFING